MVVSQNIVHQTSSLIVQSQELQLRGGSPTRQACWQFFQSPRTHPRHCHRWQLAGQEQPCSAEQQQPASFPVGRSLSLAAWRGECWGLMGRGVVGRGAAGRSVSSSPRGGHRRGESALPTLPVLSSGRLPRVFCFVRSEVRTL